MKKLILPLLLILGITMLVAVESAPSEVVGYVKYDCVPGLNFVAMPMDQGLTTTAEVGAVYNVADEYIDTINLWDPAIQDWTASTNYGGGFWDPELPVGPGSILYFNTSTALSFYSIGDMPATNAQYNIVVGLNTIMVPLNYSALTSSALVGGSIGDGDYVDTINLWDNSIQDWTASTNYGGGFWDPELPVAIGTPMYVNAGTATAWPTRAATTNNRNSK